MNLNSGALTRVVACLATLGMFGGALVAASPVSAATSCNGTFSTAGLVTCEVPAGVASISFTVVGGNGGAGTVSALTGAGGKGANIVGTLAVTPGQSLYLTVGANGGDYTNPAGTGQAFGAGGAYSAIATGGANNAGTPVVVAGAGGGGGVLEGSSPETSPGGDAGIAGSEGGGAGGTYGLTPAGPAGLASTGGAGVDGGGPGFASGAGGAAGQNGQDQSSDCCAGGGGGYGGDAGASYGDQVSGGKDGMAGATVLGVSGGGAGSGWGGGGGGNNGPGGGGSSLVPSDATASLGDGSPRVAIVAVGPNPPEPTPQTYKNTAEAGKVTGSVKRPKVNLAGTSRKQKVKVFIYRAKRPGGRAVLVATTTSKDHRWTRSKVPFGQPRAAWFCVRFSGTGWVKQFKVADKRERAARISNRGDYTRCPR